MKRTRCLAFLASTLIGGSVHAEINRPSLTLIQRGEEIYVLVANLGGQPVKVRGDYLLDRLMGGLSFEIKQKGKVFPEAAHTNPVLPDESTYVVVGPGEINGRVFDVWLIQGAYSLPKGCYTVTAVYKDRFAKDFSAFRGVSRSNQIQLCLGGAAGKFGVVMKPIR